MSAHLNPSNDSPSASRWRLWVDGCGGFLLVSGERWTVGGFSQTSPADICVRADWPRRAGSIIRQSGDYFWQPLQQDKILIPTGTSLPIGGSAQMTLECPSPLSSSATLSLRGPHRFDGHVDGAILVDQILLMGPTDDCHIRTTEFRDKVVLIDRAGQWSAKPLQSTAGSADQPPRNDDAIELSPGQRITIGSLAMTLETA